MIEFLLARIADDEARAKAVDAEDWYGVDAWGDGPTEFYFDDGAPGTPARVLAECEAKRQIVEMWLTRNEQSEHPTIAAHATGLGLAIRVITGVYADHPDYDEAWRP